LIVLAFSRSLTSYELANLEVLGHHCDPKEHMLYGRCQHPECCRRTEADKAMLRSRDGIRLCGYDLYQTLKETPTFQALTQRIDDPDMAKSLSLTDLIPRQHQKWMERQSLPPETKIVKSKATLMKGKLLEEGSSEYNSTTISRGTTSSSKTKNGSHKIAHEELHEQREILLSNTYKPLLPKPIFRLSALYTAAYNNDVDTIRKIAEIPDINPNELNPENGYTALHIAVAQDNLDAAQEIVIGWIEKGLDINLRDGITGNTALHLACMKLNKQMVMILCQEDSCDPLLYKNKKGELAQDICFIQKVRHNNTNISHEIWQIIKVTVDRNVLQYELKRLQSNSKRKK
jgi:hypothetical protein